MKYLLNEAFAPTFVFSQRCVLLFSTKLSLHEIARAHSRLRLIFNNSR